MNNCTIKVEPQVDWQLRFRSLLQGVAAGQEQAPELAELPVQQVLALRFYEARHEKSQNGRLPLDASFLGAPQYTR
jgi:hypothetical protein